MERCLPENNGVTKALSEEHVVRMGDIEREVEALRAENADLRVDNARLRRKLNLEESSWRVCRISSPLTSVRFGTSLTEPWWKEAEAKKEAEEKAAATGGPVADKSTTVSWEACTPLPVPCTPPADTQKRDSTNWRWWPLWCPCCRRPLDITAFRWDSDLAEDEQRCVDRAVEAKAAEAAAAAAAAKASDAPAEQEHPVPAAEAEAAAAAEAPETEAQAADGIPGDEGQSGEAGGFEPKPWLTLDAAAPPVPCEEEGRRPAQEEESPEAVENGGQAVEEAARSPPATVEAVENGCKKAEEAKEAARSPTATVGASTAAEALCRYAYVAAIWGYNPGFVLGALVLGVALRRAGTTHDLVLLHTDDLPKTSLAILAKVWQLREVDFVLAHESLFSGLGGRFDGVFTKLHALGLTEYTKVLVLDLDISVVKNPDELFNLPAPAAMHRAVRGARHGARVEGRRFFAAECLDADSQAFQWGQAGGINAGVMLFAPDEALYKRVLTEVCMPLHPEHIPGNGPEQDFLSRLFAPWWTHIGVGYNYQLHRTFHALEGAVQDAVCLLGKDAAYPSYGGPERMAIELNAINLIHFSGHLKMWDRNFSLNQEDEVFADRMLRDCASEYCRIWIDKLGTSWEYEERAVSLVDGVFVHNNPLVGEAVGPLIDRGLEMALGATRLAVVCWQQALQSLNEFEPTFPHLMELLRQLWHPPKVEASRYQLDDRVEVWTRGNWFVSTVRAIHDDNTVSVEFDEAGFWGCGVRHVKPSRVQFLEKEANGPVKPRSTSLLLEGEKTEAVKRVSEGDIGSSAAKTRKVAAGPIST